MTRAFFIRLTVIYLAINLAATTITQSSSVTLPDLFEMDISDNQSVTKSLGLSYSGAATTAFTAFKIRNQPADGIILSLASVGLKMRTSSSMAVRLSPQTL